MEHIFNLYFDAPSMTSKRRRNKDCDVWISEEKRERSEADVTEGKRQEEGVMARGKFWRAAEVQAWDATA